MFTVRLQFAKQTYLTIMTNATPGYAIAAGLIAGEGIGGVINAVFQIAGISGDVYGSSVGCPAGMC